MNSDICYTADTFFCCCFLQIPTGTDNNGYSYTGNPAPSMSDVSIVSVDKVVQSVRLFVLFYMSRY